jgi:hypothetical protein|tara:strand:- start:57 stop:839 length:783 start_codon:yes stop_codon:yes gene_type:complete
MQEIDNYIHTKQELSLTTLKVEIKAIRVNNKAMTISVFNQIPTYDLSFEEWFNTLSILGYVRHKSGKEINHWYVLNHKFYGLIKINALIRRDKKLLTFSNLQYFKKAITKNEKQIETLQSLKYTKDDFLNFNFPTDFVWWVEYKSLQIAKDVALEKVKNIEHDNEERVELANKAIYFLYKHLKYAGIDEEKLSILMLQSWQFDRSHNYTLKNVYVLKRELNIKKVEELQREIKEDKLLYLKLEKIVKPLFNNIGQIYIAV